MGLDAVELVIEVEEHFGVTLTDAEVGGVRTVGDLQAILHQRFAGSQTATCYSLPAFLEVRRMAREAAADPTQRVRPSTRVTDVLDASARRTLWRELGQRCNMWPLTLTRPMWMKWLLIGLAVAAFFAGNASVFIDGSYWPLGLLGAAFFVILSHLLTERFRVDPPRGAKTFGELAKRLAGLKAMASPPRSTEQIDDELRAIIVKQLGVDADEVIPTARFVEDLDMQ